MVVHNQANIDYNQLVRILVPAREYKVQVWDLAKYEFTNVEFDILEQRHFGGKPGDQASLSEEFSDFELFINHRIPANRFAYFKVIKVSQSASDPQQTQSNSSQPATSLSVTGFSNDNEILFKYENKEQQISQQFGIGLFYYKSHLQQDKKKANGEPIDDKFLTQLEKLEKTNAEGAYVFKPEWETENQQFLY